ncbi:hypothetical protein CEXT_572521 [Caerostris extrusa]|uniref:Uncharacterized protein n=1 Tax=Caerostris extrusa TaxID=172846 RepID=A0AAV4VH01_CAEEX|nr:hypothetical protein CEXT_572521 [Caerostris extrusa]
MSHSLNSQVEVQVLTQQKRTWRSRILPNTYVVPQELNRARNFPPFFSSFLSPTAFRAFDREINLFQKNLSSATLAAVPCKAERKRLLCGTPKNLLLAKERSHASFEQKGDGEGAGIRMDDKNIES